ncbi:hypothetical protein Tco_1521903 [Tanacetum coccineum]
MEARKLWDEKEWEKISMIRQKAGVRRWCKEPNVIKQEMVRYYKILFTERAKIRLRFYCDRVVIICDEDAGMLEGEISEKESAMFDKEIQGLNALVSEVVEKGIFKGVAVGADRVIVSHLQYADDTIFFGEWSKENAKALMCILKCFEEVSGLKVIYNKSKLYSISVSASDSEVMARWMSCSMGEFPFTYLGLPIDERMSCIEAWRPVVEKFINRLANWKARSMSFGGRLTLVKLVLSSLPLYYFSLFRVPSV